MRAFALPALAAALSSAGFDHDEPPPVREINSGAEPPCSNHPFLAVFAAPLSENASHFSRAIFSASARCSGVIWPSTVASCSRAPGTSAALARFSQQCARTRSTGTPTPSLKAMPKRYIAVGCPWSDARRSHRRYSWALLGRPFSRSKASARWNCASASSCFTERSADLAADTVGAGEEAVGTAGWLWLLRAGGETSGPELDFASPALDAVAFGDSLAPGGTAPIFWSCGRLNSKGTCILNSTGRPPTVGGSNSHCETAWTAE